MAMSAIVSSCPAAKSGSEPVLGDCRPPGW